tara:strand:- start:2737 stop:2997 length:261 start_codon:yes stop_codon:yes gene_type:complete
MTVYYLTPVNRLAGMNISYKSSKNKNKRKKKKQYSDYSNITLIEFRKDFTKQLKKAKKLSCGLMVDSLIHKISEIDNTLTLRNFYK